MLKYCCNTFHALKITFANEIGRLSQALRVDAHAVMDLVCRDNSLNISTAYLKPGFAFGGSCLPKDLRALLYTAKTHDVAVPMLNNVLASNQLHIEHAIDVVLATGKKSAGMLGLSFKSDTDDLRESPLVMMAERLIGKGLDLRIYDPEVNLSRLTGANRRYIEDTIPHLAALMYERREDGIEESEVVIVGINNESVIEKLVSVLQKKQFIFDLVNVADRERLRCEYQGICW